MTELLHLLAEADHAMSEAGDTDRAAQMAAYMKHHFVFHGVPSPARKKIQRPVVNATRGRDPDEVLQLVEACWTYQAREVHYVGADILRARAKALRTVDLDRVHTLIVTHSWWDTVDTLAAHTVGTMVRQHPSLVTEMDAWIDHDNMWLARTAILHQLNYKADTNQKRLFSYAEKRASDTEFFIRKALGWALRNYARIAPDEVRSFVDHHDHELSGLTKREATKHL